eukprot:TRINITY_DN1130_c0_g1_i11.p1 TRINITY_DN1130_c0_g1~~TRINITY_DN1130_c0_g1_i11.p1  ORF type:complete len:230 (+),score=25.77 TRINITY_DN1130_c0_g1_i11:554-1243(+)
MTEGNDKEEVVTPIDLDGDPFPGFDLGLTVSCMKGSANVPVPQVTQRGAEQLRVFVTDAEKHKRFISPRLVEVVVRFLPLPEAAGKAPIELDALIDTGMQMTQAPIPVCNTLGYEAGGFASKINASGQSTKVCVGVGRLQLVKIKNADGTYTLLGDACSREVELPIKFSDGPVCIGLNQTAACAFCSCRLPIIFLRRFFFFLCLCLLFFLLKGWFPPPTGADVGDGYVF